MIVEQWVNIIEICLWHGLRYNGLETTWSAGIGGRPR